LFTARLDHHCYIYHTQDSTVEMLAAVLHRRIMASTPHKLRPGLINLRSFSSTTTTASESDADDYANKDDGFVTGRVKFYSRGKFYGFCNPLHDPNMDVFVHRTEFVTDLPFEKFAKYPYLQKGQVIRFKIENTVEGGERKIRAKEITLRDGTPIPPLRNTFWSLSLADIRQELGKNISTIMEDNTATNSTPEGEEEKWQRVQDAWKIAQLRMNEVRELIERVGMRVEDFSESEKPARSSPPEPADDTTVADKDTHT